MPFHSRTFEEHYTHAWMEKVDLKRWIMYFHIIQKWNQHTAASPQFTKPCCIYIHVIILLLSNYVYICIFHEKKRKIIKMLVIKNVPLGKIFELIYLIRFIKEIHGHTFSSTFYVSPFQMILWSCITVYLLGIREVKHFKWIIMYIFKAR